MEEAKLAVRLGMATNEWVEEFAAEFEKAGLPISYNKDIKNLVPIMMSDKKKSGGTSVTFTLPCGWGDVRAVKLDLAKGLP